jgi:hypothetical protein
MPLVVFFVFLFPVVAIALLSLPIFLLIKNKTSGAIYWYVSAAVLLANSFGLLFIELLGNENLESALLTILTCSIYGSILGVLFWYLAKRQKAA